MENVQHFPFAAIFAFSTRIFFL